MTYYQLKDSQIFLVSQKAVIIENGKLLLLKNSETNCFELPGGLLEMDEEMEFGLRREIKEELNLSLKRVKKLITVSENLFKDFKLNDGTKILNARIIALVFECELEDNQGGITLSSEHCNFAWFMEKELKDLRFGRWTGKLIEKMLKEKLIF